MTNQPVHDPSSDEMLVALLDGELEGAGRAAVEQMLLSSPAVSDRMIFLANGKLPFQAAMDPLLDQAPVERLKGKLPVARQRQRGALVSRRGLLAAGIAFLGIGIAADRVASVVVNGALFRRNDEWRQVVANYMALYSTETLANLSTDADMEADQIRRVGEATSIALTSDAIAIEGMQFKRAQVLMFKGRPLAQIAYLDPTHGPVALCATPANAGAVGLQNERREGMNVVYWSTPKHAFMLIGRNPMARLQAVASRLAVALPA